MIKYAPGLLLIFILCNSFGQDQTNLPRDNVRKGYSLEEADTSKVPMSMVRSVRLAKNGDILIASYLGVFRYDGRAFTNLTGKIISAYFASFWDVLEDRNENLWLASQDSGVYFQPAGQTAVKQFTIKDGLASNEVLHIYEDRTGNIWFGACRYDGKSFRNFTTKDGFPTNNFRLLLEDKTGKLWFSGGEGMFVYDGKTFTVLKNKDGKTFNGAWSIIEDKKGNIWFGADGLWRYDGRAFTKVSERGGYSIIEDKKGNIWTTTGGSLLRYDAKTLNDKNPTVTEVASIKDTVLTGMVEAKDGSIWFGGMLRGAGVYRYDGKTVTHFKSKEAQK